MRASECLSVNKDTYKVNYVILPETKNGSKREVALSKKAIKLYLLVFKSGLKINSISLDALFRKYRNKTDIIDLHFHDSRHQAITDLSKKLDVMDLARMIGHKDLKSLMIYYNETASSIASKLD